MNSMTSQTSSSASNAAESASDSARILIQMQACIEQFESQCCQQNLKIEKSDQFDKIKKKLRQ